MTKTCKSCGKDISGRGNRAKYCKTCAPEMANKKSIKWQRENRYNREGSSRRTKENYRWFKSLGELTKDEVRMLITKKIHDIAHEDDHKEIKKLRTEIKQLGVKYHHSALTTDSKQNCATCRFYDKIKERCTMEKNPDNCKEYEADFYLLSPTNTIEKNKIAQDETDVYDDQSDY